MVHHGGIVAAQAANPRVEQNALETPSLLALVKDVDAPLCLVHFQDDAGLIPDAERFGRRYIEGSFAFRARARYSQVRLARSAVHVVLPETNRPSLMGESSASTTASEAFARQRFPVEVVRLHYTEGNQHDQADESS